MYTVSDYLSLYNFKTLAILGVPAFKLLLGFDDM
jgi:hypothetical protein